MRAKEYLGQIRRLERQIIRTREEIERNRALLLGAGLDYSKDRIQTTPEDMLSRVMAEIVDLEAEQAERIRLLSKTRDRIIEEISALPDFRHGELLYLRYVEGRRLEEIAVAMNLSFGRVRHMHGEALKSFEVCKNSTF